MKSQINRVLQIGKFFHPDKGGIESTTKAIFHGLIRNGDKTDVLCFGRHGKTKTITYGNSFVIKCGMLFQIASTPISLKFFYWFFKLRNQYDVIHIHVPNPLAALALFFFPVKGKVVVHWHSDILTHKLLYFFLSFFEHMMLRRADIILATSPVYKDESPVLKNYKEKVSLLSSSTSENKFVVNEARVQELRHRYSKKRIVFSLGRFIYYKGFEYLIEAGKYLPDDYVLLIGGGGPLKDKYLRVIGDFQLENKVFLIEDITQEDLGNYYSASDVFCLPSCEKTEAFGMVLVEAMIFSKPIVATNIPGSGVSWVNAHNLTGVNVEPKNPQALAGGIKAIFGGDYEYFARNSRLRFEQHFSDNEMIDRLQNYYNKILHIPEAVPVLEHLPRKAI